MDAETNSLAGAFESFLRATAVTRPGLNLDQHNPEDWI